MLLTYVHPSNIFRTETKGMISPLLSRDVKMTSILKLNPCLKCEGQLRSY